MVVHPRGLRGAQGAGVADEGEELVGPGEAGGFHNGVGLDAAVAAGEQLGRAARVEHVAAAITGKFDEGEAHCPSSAGPRFQVLDGAKDVRRNLFVDGGHSVCLP